MKVSVLTSIPWLDPSSSQTRAYREAIEQVRFAEELGYDCFWFTEPLRDAWDQLVNSLMGRLRGRNHQAHQDRDSGGRRTALSARSAR